MLSVLPYLSPIQFVGPLYLQRVAKFFGEGSGAVASRLANDSSNVVPLIKAAYEVSFIHITNILVIARQCKKQAMLINDAP